MPAAADSLAADFIEDVTIGAAPLPVYFSDKSLGAPSSWNWDFGDGTTSTAQSPQHTFTSPGVYSVTLVVSDGTTGSGKTKAGLITVTYPSGTALIADFTADQESGTLPLAVRFADNSVGNPTSWSWNFGDGSGSSEQNPTHSYLTAGTYAVSLTIGDGVDTATKTVAGMITVSESTTARIIFQEGFERVAPGVGSIDALGWTVINNDGDSASDGPITWSVGYDDTATYAHSGVKSAVALWNHGARNDDWLILSPITIPDGDKAIVSFWAKAFSNNYTEDFDFKLSTAGSQIGVFTRTLAEIRGQNTSWRQFTYDLSDYAGQTVNLAVQYVSAANHYGLLVDDVRVTAIPPIIEGGWSGAVTISAEQLGKVQFVTDEIGWAVGANATILKSVDGGVTWIRQNLPSEFSATDTVFGCYFVDANYGWAIGGTATSAKVLHTVDGGTTWTIQSSATQSRPTAVFFVDRYNGWICGENGTIQHTVDGGAHWSLQTTPITEHLLDIRFVDGNIGWAGGEYRKILHTVNGGATWTEQSSGLATPSSANRMFGHMDFIDAATGWMVGAEGVILHTADGGVSWQQQTSNTTAELTSVDFIDAKYGWVVGANGLMLATANGGVTWQGQASGTEGDLASLVLSGQSSGWAVTTGGTMLQLSAVAESQLDSDGDGVANAVDAFPNNGAEWLDTDFDGIGNNSDLDDDGDGMPDAWEIQHGLNPLLAADGASDLDGDGESNLAEYLAGTDPRANSVTISGRLTGEDGAGLAGLWVEAASASFAIQAGDESDADGWYAIMVPPATDFTVSVPGGGTYPFAVYDGATQWKNATPVDTSGGSVSGIDFVLSPGLTISGTVSGLSSGQTVSVEAWSDSTNCWGYTTVVGAGGIDSFTIRGLAAADDYRLTLRSEDYQSGYIRSDGTVGSWSEGLILSSGAENVPVVVSAGYSISGTITGLTVGDQLWVDAWSRTTGRSSSVKIVAAATQAQFEVSGLGMASDYRVSLSSEKYGNGFYVGSPGGIAVTPGTSVAATLIDLSAGDVDGVSFAAVPSVSIAGTVTGLQAGEKALLTAWSVAGGFFATSEISGTGGALDYAIACLSPADDYKLLLSSYGATGGYYSLAGMTDLDKAELLDGSAPVPGVDFALSAGNSVSGIITGLADGEQIRVEAWSSTAWYWTATSLVGNGSPVVYTLGGLPDVTDLEVRFRPANHQQQVMASVDSGANPIDINCTLVAGYSLSGFITGANAYEKVTVSVDSLANGLHQAVTVVADADGSAQYTVNRIGLASDYVVLAETATKKVFYGNVLTRDSATAVEVNSADLNGVNISLAAESVYILSGAVSGVAAGTLVQIDVWDTSTGVWSGVSCYGPGLFELSLPAGNNYRLGLHADGYMDVYFGGLDGSSLPIAVYDVSQAAAIDLSGADKSLGGILMTVGYQYTGKVYFDADGDAVADPGEELAGATVEVNGGSISRSCTSDGRGEFRLEGLFPTGTVIGGEVFDGGYSVKVLSDSGAYSGSMTITDSDVTDSAILIAAP